MSACLPAHKPETDISVKNQNSIDMSGINKVLLIGRLGQDPEVRHLENGSVVAQCSLATSEKFKDKSGEQKEITEWHRLVVWNKLAEVVEKYLKKGSQLYVEGKLATRSWDKDGVTQYTTEIIVNNLQMLGSSSSNRPPAPSADNEPPMNLKSDDLTF